MGEDAYGKVARFYDRFVDPFNAPLRAAAIKLAEPTADSKVLDVGCGTGTLVEAFADAGANAFGVDLSEAMLTIARDRLGDRADLRSGDATDLPWDEDTFDLTCASLFLHELEPDVRSVVLTEMARVTGPEGRLLIIDYRIGSLRWKGRLSRAVSTVAERFAGTDHYRNWRAFMAAGGIPAGAEQLRLAIDKEKIAAGGNVGIWLLRR